MKAEGMMEAIALRVADSTALYRDPYAMRAFKSYMDWNLATEALLTNGAVMLSGGVRAEPINLGHYGPRLSQNARKLMARTTNEILFGMKPILEQAAKEITFYTMFGDSNIAQAVENSADDNTRVLLLKLRDAIRRDHGGDVQEFVKNLYTSLTIAIHQKNEKLIGSLALVLNSLVTLVNFIPVKNKPVELLEFVFDKLMPRRGVEVASPQDRADMATFCDVTSSMLHLNICEALSTDARDVIIVPAGSFESALVSPYAGKGSMSLAKTHSDGKIDIVEFEKQLTVLRLQKKCPKALFLTNPTNPYGKFYSEDEMRQLGAIAIRNGIKIISDEQFWGFELSGKDAKSIASLKVSVDGTQHDMLNHTVIIQSTSKLCANEDSKFSIAVTGDKKLIKDMEAIAAKHQLSLSYAACAGSKLLLPGAPETDKQRIKLSGQYDELVGMVARINTFYQQEVLKIEGDKPENGFFAVLSVDKGIFKKVGVGTENELHNYLLATIGIRIRPLESMMGNDSGNERIKFRVNFSHATHLFATDSLGIVTPASIQEGLMRVADLTVNIEKGLYDEPYHNIHETIEVLKTLTPKCCTSIDLTRRIMVAPIPEIEK
jgi:aspartate/methionine/tyrosine aminotransferase